MYVFNQEINIVGQNQWNKFYIQISWDTKVEFSFLFIFWKIFFFLFLENNFRYFLFFHKNNISFSKKNYQCENCQPKLSILSENINRKFTIENLLIFYFLFIFFYFSAVNMHSISIILLELLNCVFKNK